MSLRTDTRVGANSDSQGRELRQPLPGCQAGSERRSLTPCSARSAPSRPHSAVPRTNLGSASPRPAPPRVAVAPSCGGVGRGRWLGASAVQRFPPGLGACERQGGGTSAMRWPRGPRGAWRLLPRRSLLAVLFLFSLSSSFLYFVYVAPGIGKWQSRGASPFEMLSNVGRLPQHSSRPRVGPGALGTPL